MKFEQFRQKVEKMRWEDVKKFLLVALVSLAPSLSSKMEAQTNNFQKSPDNSLEEKTPLREYANLDTMSIPEKFAYIAENPTPVAQLEREQALLDESRLKPIVLRGETARLALERQTRRDILDKYEKDPEPQPTDGDIDDDITTYVNN